MTHFSKIKKIISGLALCSMMVACAAAVPAQEVKTTAAEPENTENIVYGISEQDSRYASLGVGVGFFLMGSAAGFIVRVMLIHRSTTKNSMNQQAESESEDQSHE